MFIIREIFIAKPGQAGKFAKMIKESMSGSKMRVLTDFVSDYNKVVMESEVEHLEEFENMMAEYKAGKTDKKEQDAMAGYTDMYLTGKREIYQVVE